MNAELRRSFGVFDAVVIGLGAMVGAGIFVALGPAADAAGSGGGLLVALGVAGLVAYCNAMASARLAARYPRSGGTYVYGRECLGSFWGYLAGWAFVVGKTASCAAMALTVGAYVWPGHPHAVAVAAVVALTAVNYRGVQKSALLTRVIVALVLAVLAAAVVVLLGAGGANPVTFGGELTAGGVLQAAGLLFFAFAGYARIATLGEEVRDPARTIPRAVPIALGVTLVVYVLVAVGVLTVLGPEALAASAAPLTDAARAAGAGWLVPVVAVGAAVAALGSLLSLILGVSRTTLAMARDAYLPTALAVVHHRFQVPHRAELAVGAVVAAVAATADVRGAIGFSSFGVLVYYAIANASAWTLGPARRPLAVLGFTGCAALAFALPLGSVLAGSGVVAAGVVAWAVSRGRAVPPRS
ncbi:MULTISPECIES: APC family permease [Streptomyces]|uniref:Putative amino acid transporter n=1 Tax=Streptomyces venezuelae (strain ATCC 10712 / CBS 650.69 / DSM 40230 / JCM 4526 / NBRC 13096 / PD 04745) TaxID=953739 RepID=F2RIQ2_STRVP|nr:APC family permease [Streptomyces venezuelae]APE23303.1 transporter [Streptomyces venezuelae]QES00681.1 amino acid permease [Streptomyces venezuelae ATCC 10712]CCA57608.1 putative amino acid transporter [Streptomyces venezuelae ATCC 10712]